MSGPDSFVDTFKKYAKTFKYQSYNKSLHRMLIQHFWANGKGIKELATLCANEVSVEEGVYINEIPAPRESVRRLLDAAKVRLPKILPHKGIKVTTKKKLASRRYTH